MASISSPPDVRTASMVVAVVATVPYLTLKLMWLTGSTVGITTDAGAQELHSTRYVAGNLVTVALVLLAAAFAVALTRSSANRVPAVVVFVLGVGATGLLAPILLGLPLGLGAQLARGEGLRTGDDSGLAGWVFALVYGGFGVLGAALAILVLDHVRRRWGWLLRVPPKPPGIPATVVGALGLLPFAAAMAYWGVVGVGGSGPQGMVLTSQRTVLVVSGLLAATALVAPFATRAGVRWPRLAWLLTWTGCCVAALQAPIHLLLAQGGQIQPVVALVAILATPGACLYGLAVARDRLAGAALARPSDP